MRRMLSCLLVIGCGGSEQNAVPDAAVDAATDVAPPDAMPPSTGCRDGWCWLYPQPQGSSLTSIVGFSETDVWIAGHNAALAHYNGSTWTTFATPPAENEAFYTLHGIASNDVWAGGENGIYHWDGSSWTRSFDAFNDSVLVIGGAANDLWAWGSNTYHWNGTAWEVKVSPATNGRPLGFWSSGGSTFTVSTGGGIAKWLGSGWGVSDAGGHLGNAASFIDPNHIVLAGGDGSVWFMDNGTWTAHNTPTNTSWTTVAAVSLDDVWVSNGVRAAHWNGTTWSEQAVAVGAMHPFSTQALWRDPTGTPWLVTADAEVHRRVGTSWTSLVPAADLYQVGGTSPTDLWVTTRYGARHYDGTSWTDHVLPAQPTNCSTNDLWAAAPNNVWIALECRATFDSDEPPRKLLHWDGSAWSTIQLGNESGTFAAGFRAIWGSGANDIYAAAWTAVFHFDGSTWSPLSGLVGGFHIFGTSATDVYIVSGAGALWHWNGTAWSMKTSPYIAGAWQNSPTDIWLGGGGTGGAHFDGTFFVPAPFEDKPIGSANEMFVRERRELARYTGGFGGTRTATTAFFSILDTWRAPNGALYVITGNPGGIVVREP
jgi:hypothetical protein